MSSIIVMWNGQCESSLQRDLLGFIKKLAVRNEKYWTAYPEPLNAFNRMLYAQRSNGLPKLPTTREFNGAISGRILLNSDVLNFDSEAVNELRESGLPFRPDQWRPNRGMFELEHAGLVGVDFRLFDALGLYPGENRLSFVFLDLPDCPTLDDRLVHVHTAEQCRAAQHPEVKQATAYLEAPFIHLRNHFVTWIDWMMAWMQFFIPGLHYHPDSEEGVEAAKETFARVEAAVGRLVAMKETFEFLCDDFEKECEASINTSRAIA